MAKRIHSVEDLLHHEQDCREHARPVNPAVCEWSPAAPHLFARLHQALGSDPAAEIADEPVEIRTIQSLINRFEAENGRLGPVPVRLLLLSPWSDDAAGPDAGNRERANGGVGIPKAERGSAQCHTLLGKTWVAFGRNRE